MPSVKFGKIHLRESIRNLRYKSSLEARSLGCRNDPQVIAQAIARATSLYRNADLLSEILLLVSASVILVTLLLILVAALAQIGAST